MTTDEAKLPPCPFCGGHAVECWKRKPAKQRGSIYIESYATASIACGKCGVRGRSYTVNCQDRYPTGDDIDNALVHAKIYWSARPIDAAAPELLEAVKVLHGLLHQTQSEFVPSTDAACQLNYDALTKYEWMTK